jgi:hypothetical protein
MESFATATLHIRLGTHPYIYGPPFNDIHTPHIGGVCRRTSMNSIECYLLPDVLMRVPQTLTLLRSSGITGSIQHVYMYLYSLIHSAMGR